MFGPATLQHNEHGRSSPRRLGALSARSQLLVAVWIVEGRYGLARWIEGSRDAKLRVDDFDRLATLLQDRASSVRAQLARDIGDVERLRTEIEDDIRVALAALNHIIEHEERPFPRRQMEQMLASLEGLARPYRRRKPLAA